MVNNSGFLLAVAAVALVGLLMVAFTVERRPGFDLTPAEAEQIVNQYPPCVSELSQPALEKSVAPNLYFSPAEVARAGIPCNPTQFTLSQDVSVERITKLSGPDETPSIDTPQFEPVWIADQWLADDALLLTLNYDGVVRAYPIAILNWHEVVNDWIGGTPVAVVFCPFCQGGAAFERPELNGKAAEFGTSGRIYLASPLLYDWATGSFWSTTDGQPIAGSQVGVSQNLTKIPVGLSRWGDFKLAYPNSEVLARPTTATALGGRAPRDMKSRAKPLPRNYWADPYWHYNLDQNDTFGTPVTDGRLPAKELVTGVHIGNEAIAYRREPLESLGLLNDEIGGQPVLVLWNPATRDVAIYSRVISDETLEFLIRDGELVDTKTNTLWSFDGVALNGPYAKTGEELKQLPRTTEYWFAWAAAHPTTDLWYQ